MASCDSVYTLLWESIQYVDHHSFCSSFCMIGLVVFHAGDICPVCFRNSALHTNWVVTPPFERAVGHWWWTVFGNGASVVTPNEANCILRPGSEPQNVRSTTTGWWHRSECWPWGSWLQVISLWGKWGVIWGETFSVPSQAAATPLRLQSKIKIIWGGKGVLVSESPQLKRPAEK